MTPEEKQARKRDTHRQWRLGPGREKYLAKRKRHREKYATLRAEKQRAYVALDPEAQAARVRAWNDRNPERLLWLSARSRARKLGRDFDIEIGDIVIPTHCPVLEIELVRARGRGRTGGHDASPTVDRIDSSKGYVKGNIWVISKRANSLKGAGTLEELRSLLKHLEGV